MTATLEINETPLAYSSILAHLTDELTRLDLLIRSRLNARSQNRTPSVLDPFVGLVVSEEEVSALLLPPGDERSHDARLQEQIDKFGDYIESRLKATADNRTFLPLPHLKRLFKLTDFEFWVLIVTLAPELDRKYEKLYAYLQDDVTRKKPTVDLVMRLTALDPAERVSARAAFGPGAPLMRHQVVSLSDAGEPLLSRALKLDDRIVSYLLGSGSLDSRLDGAARFAPSETGVEMLPSDKQLLSKLSSFARSALVDSVDRTDGLLFYFRGSAGTGRRAMARSLCADLELPLIEADLLRLLEGRVPFEEAIRILCREAILRPAALCFFNVDSVLFDEKNHIHLKPLFDAMRSYSRITFILGSQAWRPQAEQQGFILTDLEFLIPPSNIRKTLWKRELAGRSCEASDADLGLLASNFQFTPAQISDAVDKAHNRAAWRKGDGRTGGSSPQIDLSDLQSAARNQSTAKLTTLAQKIEPRYDWGEIVLPDDQLEQLHEICVQARHRDVVYGDWGFEQKLSLGRGLNVLFSGPAGTGKTMAAEVIARELGLDLYKIDLSQVVSKYIGETEKNLHQIFHEAKSSFAILFFDEADALFGKRSEVKDAHDRYSNIEIGYLLQKMEEYDGIAILATNLRQNMDDAFVRRLQVIVDFPFPNERYRELIWKVIFPRQSPVGGDVDFELLAQQIKLAGGNIKNIAVSAAFFAANDRGLIRMPHVLRAARREYQKLGRIWTEFSNPENVAVS
jgi:SpoVK/Ycf46/Vps4 family AAA+-type ATPase